MYNCNRIKKHSNKENVADLSEVRNILKIQLHIYRTCFVVFLFNQ